MKTLTPRQKDKLKSLQIARPISAEPDFEGDRELQTTTREKDLEGQLDYALEKLEELRENCRSIFYRNESEIERDIQDHVNTVMSQPQNLIQDYVNINYNRAFFRNEPDTQFKYRLVEALMEALQKRLNGYSNSLLQAILEEDSSVRGLMLSWIDD